jgi:alpha-galactosidase
VIAIIGPRCGPYTKCGALYPTWQKNFEQWKLIGEDHGYHYLGSAIWFNRIGKAIGEAMLELMKSAK